MRATLDTIVVNWNAGRQLRECLESLAGVRCDCFQSARVVVVDNNSSDGSARGLEDLALPLTVLSNRENLGFGAACNQGAKDSTADYILFLNPDTIVGRDSLDAPIGFLNNNERYGICGIQLVGERGTIARSCTRFPTLRSMLCYAIGLNRLAPRLFKGYPMDDWPHSESREVDHVIGAFYLVRRTLFETLGGFDERFFVYLEDLDFSLRARKAGFFSYFLASVTAFHKGGGSSEQVKATRLFYSLRSRLLYVGKHFGILSATLVLLGTLFVEPVARVVFGLARRSRTAVCETVSAYCRLWCALPAIFKTSFSRRQGNHLSGGSIVGGDGGRARQPGPAAKFPPG